MLGNTKFIGRRIILEKLSGLISLGGAKLIVLKGRRRIGKSRLLSEFGKKFKKVVIFSGLAPAPGITAKTQRQEFVNQLQRQLNIRGIKADDWSDLFWNLSEQEGLILPGL